MKEGMGPKEAMKYQPTGRTSIVRPWKHVEQKKIVKFNYKSFVTGTGELTKS